MKRVLVAGAGISGLSLAHALRARGLRPMVIESAQRPGGTIASHRDGGFLCEAGPASFLDGDGALHVFVRELGLSTRLVEATGASGRRLVEVGGALRPIPTTPMAFFQTDLLSPWSKLRVLADLVLPRGRAGRGEEESVAGFGCRRLGRKGAQLLLYPLLSGLYVAAPEEISAPSTFPRLAEMERAHRSLLLGAAMKPGERGGAARPRLASFEGGMQELTDALAREMAGDLHLGTSIRRVAAEGARYRAFIDCGDLEEEIEADAVALAIPAYEAAPVVEALDPGLAEAIAQIPYAPVSLVYLGYPASALPQGLDAYGFLSPPESPLNLLGAVFTSAVFPRRAPERMALIAVRLGGARHASLDGLGDGDLTRMARDDLEAVLRIHEPPVFSRVIRHGRALPQYALGHRQKVEAVDAAERRHPGLFMHGNAYRGLGLADCARESRALAARIGSALGC